MRLLRRRSLCVAWAFAALLCALAVAGCGGAEPEAAVPDIRGSLNIAEDFREEFIHGEKGPSYQRYIVLHDSEGEGAASELVEYWAGNGELAATHFVINKDGSIVQCVPLDSIAHHAGFGDAGNNEVFGVEEDGRDDRVGTVPLDEAYPDYGMNSYSVGITLVHMGSAGEEYPKEQLEALDGLIAYVDAYYGGDGGQIIERREWRSDCEGCSAEFGGYLASYKQARTHAGEAGSDA